jgi:hypothetical protein
MSWVATAVIGGAVVGGAASYLGGREQADAARDAAGASAESARYQTDVQKQIYDQTRADQTPWRDAGQNALTQLTAGTAAGGDLMRSFSMEDYEADPGYAFRQAEGMKAIERSAAARGGALSGGALRGIERFGQGLASEEYGNAFNRYQTNQTNRFNRLASVAGVGQTANAATGQAGSNYANAITGISQANATNQGNAILAAGNARASGYAGVGNALASAPTNYLMMQSFRPPAAGV